MIPGQWAVTRYRVVGWLAYQFGTKPHLVNKNHTFMASRWYIYVGGLLLKLAGKKMVRENKNIENH